MDDGSKESFGRLWAIDIMYFIIILVLLSLVWV